MTESEEQATRQTDLGQLVGTLAYMSPEQALADPVESYDSIPDEIFPDTTTDLIERWEKVCRIPPRTSDAKPLSNTRSSSC